MEPWAVGFALNSTQVESVLGTLPAVPVGVRVLYVSVIAEAVAATALTVAVTMSEAPARVLADMVGQHPVFSRSGLTIPGGAAGHLVNVFAGIASTRRWYWDLEPLSGPIFVNVAYHSAVISLASVTFGLVGFRRIDDGR